MKKITLAALAFLIATHSFASFGSDIEKELQQAFHKSFPSAGNIHWEEEQNGYAVSFTLESVFTRITYDRKGRFTGSLRNYTGQFLPFYLTNEIRKEYPGQEIYGVTEITSKTDITYYIKLVGPRYWTTVRVDNDGTISVTDRYRKDH